MQTIMEAVIAADLIIWSFPLYYFGMPPHLKAVCDRMLPLVSMKMQTVGETVQHVARYDFSPKRYVMISGCGFPNFENNFKPVLMQFYNLYGDRLTAITVPESPMFQVPDAAPVTKPFLEKVVSAGREYAREGKLSEETKTQLHIPMIPNETYIQIVNAQAKD